MTERTGNIRRGKKFGRPVDETLMKMRRKVDKKELFIVYVKSKSSIYSKVTELTRAKISRRKSPKVEHF